MSKPGNLLFPFTIDINMRLNRFARKVRVDLSKGEILRISAMFGPLPKLILIDF